MLTPDFERAQRHLIHSSLQQGVGSGRQALEKRFSTVSRKPLTPLRERFGIQCPRLKRRRNKSFSANLKLET